MIRPDKFAIYQEANALFQELHGDKPLLPYGACLYWAQVTLMTLTRFGLYPCLQAGSMLWRMVPDALDDGTRDTHYGFVWSPDSARSRAQIAEGGMPEIHIWCGLVQTQEIVDFSIGGLMEGAKLRGLKWLAEPPPLYLWCHTSAVPEAANYDPNREATLLAMESLLKMSNEETACRDAYAI